MLFSVENEETKVAESNDSPSPEGEKGAAEGPTHPDSPPPEREEGSPGPSRPFSTEAHLPGESKDVATPSSSSLHKQAVPCPTHPRESEQESPQPIGTEETPRDSHTDARHTIQQPTPCMSDPSTLHRTLRCFTTGLPSAGVLGHIQAPVLNQPKDFPLQTSTTDRGTHAGPKTSRNGPLLQQQQQRPRDLPACIVHLSLTEEGEGQSFTSLTARPASAHCARRRFRSSPPRHGRGWGKGSVLEGLRRPRHFASLSGCRPLSAETQSRRDSQRVPSRPHSAVTRLPPFSRPHTPLADGSPSSDHFLRRRERLMGPDGRVLSLQERAKERQRRRIEAEREREEERGREKERELEAEAEAAAERERERRKAELSASRPDPHCLHEHRRIALEFLSDRVRALSDTLVEEQQARLRAEAEAEAVGVLNQTLRATLSRGETDVERRVVEEFDERLREAVGALKVQHEKQTAEAESRVREVVEEREWLKRQLQEEREKQKVVKADYETQLSLLRSQLSEAQTANAEQSAVAIDSSTLLALRRTIESQRSSLAQWVDAETARRTEQYRQTALAQEKRVFEEREGLEKLMQQVLLESIEHHQAVAAGFQQAVEAERQRAWGRELRWIAAAERRRLLAGKGRDQSGGAARTHTLSRGGGGSPSAPSYVLPTKPWEGPQAAAGGGGLSLLESAAVKAGGLPAGGTREARAN
uniref:Uncharacterized protein n=1 Tax=Chromera velia CCMP2878 TaxID=1169474 RepID=A0A0G4FKS7_9ALVE|eukprot:Cvel_17482.t1-p1 / transcript=Cvel_17482.t1 / gene=Cvel_17482 / organism=Chromera_velia_CCMP2878 / gene_product=hypothetical protein / transcript_product=hypothetical protein / location=Cvel_scaffold1398:34126-40551(+) / protein_length=700 / sequence_SO=supercontig / SO=protein_coding / is_pseudo=false